MPTQDSLRPAHYARAITAALLDAPEKHRELLTAHFAAPRHTRTYSELATDVGYANYGAVNLQYGTLARRIAEGLGIFERPSEGFWGAVLVEWTGDYDPRGTRFRLKSSVVDALESLGFSRRRDTRSNKRLQPTARRPLPGKQSRPARRG